MKDFLSDAALAALLTFGFTAVVLALHHAGLLYN